MSAEIVKAGESTTEYEVAKSARLWMIIGLVLGVLLEAGGAVISALTDAGVAGVGLIVGGVVLQALTAARNALVDAGYIKSRTVVKSAASGGK